MKKLVLLLMLCASLAAFAPPAVAQLYSRPGLGFKAGYGLTDLYGGGVDALVGSAHPKFGFIGGVFLRIRLRLSLTLEPELLYAVNGIKRDGTITDTVQHVSRSGVLKTQLTYLEIPVLLKVHFPSPLGITPNLFAGPILSIKQSAKVVFSDPSVTLEFPIDENVAKTDFGIVAGAGVNFLFGTGQIVTELRYTRGFVSVDGSDQNLDAFNHSIAFMAGFIFHFPQKFGP